MLLTDSELLLLRLRQSACPFSSDGAHRYETPASTYAKILAPKVSYLMLVCRRCGGTKEIVVRDARAPGEAQEV